MLSQNKINLSSKFMFQKEKDKVKLENKFMF